MLSKNDKKWIEETIRTVVEDCLTVEITMEKRRDEKTGQPLAVPEITKTNEYIPVYWAKHLGYFEGALRGLQEQVTLETASQAERLGSITNLLINFENSLKCVAAISDKMKQIEPYIDEKLLEHKEEE